MRKIFFGMVLTLAFMGGTVMAQNLLGTNWGFDDQEPVSFSLTDADNNNDKIPQWRVYSVSGYTTLFEVKAEETAPSSPNVFEFSTESGSWLQETINIWPQNPSGLTSGHTYKVSFWARAMDATTDHMFSVMGFYDDAGSYSGQFVQTMHALTDQWIRQEVEFVLPEGLSGVDPQFSCDLSAWDIQLDSVTVEDVTTVDRIRNGSFENSSVSLPYWSVGNVGGRNLSATISTDANDSEQAVAISQTENFGDGTDGALTSDNLAWKGSNEMYISFWLKDTPTVSTDDYVLAVVASFDTEGTWLGNYGFYVGKPGQSGYVHHTYNVTELPEGTAQVNFALRICNEQGAATAGDCLVDNISIGDVTDGFEIPVNSARSWFLFN